MMSTTTEKRNYNFTDSELTGFAKDTATNLRHDMDMLTGFGISTEKIEELEALADNFAYFTTDALSNMEVLTVIQEKNKLNEEVRTEIRNMILRCKMKWGRKSQQEMSLDAAGINNIKNEILLVTARRVHEIMSGYLPELAMTGLTQEILVNFENLNIAFETAINGQKIMSSQRISTTSERIKLGNELYELVSNYCKIGKNFFSHKNPAKYKNYKIYRGSRKLKKSTNIIDEVAANGVEMEEGTV